MRRKDALSVLYDLINSGILDLDIEVKLDEIVRAISEDNFTEE